MNKEEEKKKIETDPDYIYCPSAENSLEKFLTKHPEGVNDEKAAQVLMTTPDKVRKYYDEAVELIKRDMGVDDDE
jgi:GTP cyclohydrolase I